MRFGINVGVQVCETQGDVRAGINITNYEKLHHFAPSIFAGVVLDESSVLKNYTGVTKRTLIESFTRTPYKLACTATPAPNDRKELGNHAEFLGVMPSNEMLARWFINDSMKSGGYRLRKHGERDFWNWVASWAVCISKPSSIGYSDEGYDLPPLNVEEHVIAATNVPAGFLFAPDCKVSATTVHAEKRACLTERTAKLRELIDRNFAGEQWLIWCDTDYEQDAIEDALPAGQFVSIRGSNMEHQKIDREWKWRNNEIPGMLSKGSIFGMGVNWQHCRNMTWFAGYSYEMFYQAVRRIWRFGQKRPVNVHIILSDAEQSILTALKSKQNEHQEMQSEMAELMRDGMLESLYERRELRKYQTAKQLQLPAWLASKGTE